MADPRFENAPVYIAVLALILDKAGIAQAQLAAEVSMDRHRLQHYFAGRRRPTLETMIKLDAGLFRILRMETQIEKVKTSRRRRAERSS